MKTPEITISPILGASGSMGDVRTDMLVLTQLAGIPIQAPSTLDESVRRLISRKAAGARFKGELGQYVLIDLDPRHYPASTQRYILLVGVGAPNKFDSKTACTVFQVVVEQALKLGIEQVTIPFTSNRLTAANLNMRGTAHLLKEVVETTIAQLTREPELDEVQIVCTPQARKHIAQGLRIPVRHTRTCCGDPS